MIERNLWGETVVECAQRFLKDAHIDGVDEPSEKRAHAREHAARCIRIFNAPHEQELREFYLRVHTHFSEG